jgi:hypothetical protein
VRDEAHPYRLADATAIFTHSQRKSQSLTLARSLGLMRKLGAALAPPVVLALASPAAVTAASPA